MKRALWAALAALFFCLPASAQWTTVVAGNIQNVKGDRLARGRLCFRPVDNAGNPISFTGGGGQTVSAQACFEVTNGAIAAGARVLDTAQTTPAHVCYAVTIRDTGTGKLVLGGDASPGYDCVQPTGATWNLDSYQPNLAAAPLQNNVLSLERGGTGNNSWTAARCVRVAQDGSKLEAAPTDCGTGGGGGATDWTHPGAIGAATPNTGQFTTVDANAFRVNSLRVSEGPLSSPFRIDSPIEPSGSTAGSDPRDSASLAYVSHWRLGSTRPKNSFSGNFYAETWVPTNPSTGAIALNGRANSQAHGGFVAALWTQAGQGGIGGAFNSHVEAVEVNTDCTNSLAAGGMGNTWGKCRGFQLMQGAAVDPYAWGLNIENYERPLLLNVKPNGAGITWLRGNSSAGSKIFEFDPFNSRSASSPGTSAPPPSTNISAGASAARSIATPCAR